MSHTRTVHTGIGIMLRAICSNVTEEGAIIFIIYSKMLLAFSSSQSHKTILNAFIHKMSQ